MVTSVTSARSTETSAPRHPRVICHMIASVDGRIVTGGWPLSPEARRQYEQVHASYDADGWICGRVTMEPFASRVRSEAEVAREHAGVLWLRYRVEAETT